MPANRVIGNHKIKGENPPIIQGFLRHHLW
jgi:hypothetical protein